MEEDFLTLEPVQEIVQLLYSYLWDRINEFSRCVLFFFFHSVVMLGNSFGSHLASWEIATSFYVTLLDTASAPKITILKQNRGRSCPSVCAQKKWELHSSAQSQALVLNNDEKEKWEASRQALTAFKFSIDEEDKILAKAFGYIHSPYWSEERPKEVPRRESVKEKLDFLRGLGLSDDDLCKVLKKFPEVLGCSLDEELENNVKVLQKDWGIEGKTLRNLLLRNPKVLGYNVDCKGDCMAKCTRCWVRF